MLPYVCARFVCFCMQCFIQHILCCRLLWFHLFLSWSRLFDWFCFCRACYMLCSWFLLVRFWTLSYIFLIFQIFVQLPGHYFILNMFLYLLLLRVTCFLLSCNSVFSFLSLHVAFCTRWSSVDVCICIAITSPYMCVCLLWCTYRSAWICRAMLPLAIGTA